MVTILRNQISLKCIISQVLLISPQNTEVLSRMKVIGMNRAKQMIALGAFLLGAVNAQQVVRSDSETGQKHVGCYYGVWAYTR